MSFSDLTSKVHDHIKDTFGEIVTYEPLAGGPYTPKGVFNERFQFVDPDTEQVVSSQQPNLGVKRADLPADPVKGDIVTVRGVQYRVHDSQEDGEGWVKFLMYEVD